MSANSLSIVLSPTGGVSRLGFGSLPLQWLKNRYGSPEQGSRYIELQGFNVHYRDEGDRSKPALVLIHGIVASLHTWDGWVQALSEHFRIIRFDVPGFGLTGGARDGVYNAQRMIDVLEDLLDYLQVDEAMLAGSSLGGYIAWNFALSAPARVRKLILLDPAGYPMKKIPWMIAAAGIPGATWLMPIWMPRALIAQGVKEVYGEPEKIQDGVVQRYYDLSRRPGNRLAMMEIFRVLMAVNKGELHNTHERVGRLNIPVLLMWGELDRWILPEQVALWQRDLPTIEVKVYPGVGHIPMEEIAEQSAADALRFLHA